MTRTGQLVGLGTGSFIYELRGALEAAVCSDMIHRFETCTEHQYQDRIGQGQAEQPDIKRSTDLRVSGRPEWRDRGYNVQRTRPGEFYHWHVGGGPGEFSQRQLVAFWTPIHRGVTPSVTTKYIATTWVCFS